MIREDDDRPVKPPTTHQIGQALDAFSVEELRDRIDLLHQEIVWLETAFKAKQASRQAADAFFKA